MNLYKELTCLFPEMHSDCVLVTLNRRLISDDGARLQNGSVAIRYINKRKAK